MVEGKKSVRPIPNLPKKLKPNLSFPWSLISYRNLLTGLVNSQETSLRQQKYFV
jgi:hypothetical protein